MKLKQALIPFAASDVRLVANLFFRLVAVCMVVFVACRLRGALLLNLPAPLSMFLSLK